MKGLKFAECATAMEQVWPTLKITQSEIAMEIWYDLVKDIDLRAFLTIIKAHRAETHTVITPADVRRRYAELCGIKAPDPDAAWGEVTKAIRAHGSYGEQAALDSMSADVRAVVQAMGWRELCMSENQMADRAHFMKLYGTRAEKQAKQAQLPPTLKLEIEQLAASMALEGPKKRLELPGRTRYEEPGYEEVGYDEV